MKKKILSALLCATLAVTGMASANAAEVKEHKGFKALGQEMTLGNNKLKGYVYNVDEDYDVYVKYDGEENDYKLYFKDCISAPTSIDIPDTEKYAMHTGGSSGSGGNINRTYSFANTGGKYKKVRIKLSEFSSYFNEDGSHTKEVKGENHDFNFTNEGNGYRSHLVIKSGGVVNGVVPDKNGEVEIFVSAKVGTYASYYTDFRWRSGGGGGIVGGSLGKLTFGNVDGSSWVDVNDVTTLQLYLAGTKELDTLGLFHADVNCDNIYDVKDVTALQLGISKK